MQSSAYAYLTTFPAVEQRGNLHGGDDGDTDTFLEIVMSTVQFSGKCFSMKFLKKSLQNFNHVWLELIRFPLYLYIQAIRLCDRPWFVIIGVVFSWPGWCGELIWKDRYISQYFNKGGEALMLNHPGALPPPLSALWQILWSLQTIPTCFLLRVFLLSMHDPDEDGNPSNKNQTTEMIGVVINVTKSFSSVGLLGPRQVRVVDSSLNPCQLQDCCSVHDPDLKCH